MTLPPALQVALKTATTLTSRDLNQNGVVFSGIQAPLGAGVAPLVDRVAASPLHSALRAAFALATDW